MERGHTHAPIWLLKGRVRGAREARERPHAEPPGGPVVRARGLPAQPPRRRGRPGRRGGRRVGQG